MLLFSSNPMNSFADLKPLELLSVTIENFANPVRIIMNEAVILCILEYLIKCFILK